LQRPNKAIKGRKSAEIVTREYHIMTYIQMVEFNPTAWKLIFLISYTIKDTQEGSAVMLQGEMKILSHPSDVWYYLAMTNKVGWC
jgi:hypothetical protein